LALSALAAKVNAGLVRQYDTDRALEKIVVPKGKAAD
jgi:hypothetical protein